MKCKLKLYTKVAALTFKSTMTMWQLCGKGKMPGLRPSTLIEQPLEIPNCNLGWHRKRLSGPIKHP
jgi:hypothetical protein